jgi:aldehyde:ferredoxin oxidoreductase
MRCLGRITPALHHTHYILFLINFMKKHINDIYNQVESFSYDDIMRLISELEVLAEWVNEREMCENVREDAISEVEKENTNY